MLSHPSTTAFVVVVSFAMLHRRKAQFQPGEFVTNRGEFLRAYSEAVLSEKYLP
jgi:hypothetical protein